MLFIILTYGCLRTFLGELDHNLHGLFTINDFIICRRRFVRVRPPPPKYQLLCG